VVGELTGDSANRLYRALVAAREEREGEADDEGGPAA
jgi:hypothetical protein